MEADKEYWQKVQKIAEQITVEQDSEKLAELVTELNRLLHEKYDLAVKKSA